MNPVKFIFCYLIPFVLVVVLYEFFAGIFYLGFVFLILGFFQPCAAVFRLFGLLKNNKQVPKGLKNYFVLTAAYLTGLGILSYLLFNPFSSEFFLKLYMGYLSLPVLLVSYYLCEVVYSSGVEIKNG